MSKNLGRHSGFISVGTVVDVENDPTQSGQVRVRWLTGSGVQDQVGDEDLPWTRCSYPSSDPARAQTGGPGTGLQVGSTVIGMPLDGDGQDYVIIGSMVRSGKGDIDQPWQIDSELPQPAKVQENGGERQPRYDDVNSVVTEKSIVSYAEEEGGPDGSAGKYCQIDDPIGTLDAPISDGRP